jgi:hypothetical protein
MSAKRESNDPVINLACYRKEFLCLANKPEHENERENYPK